MSNVFVSTTTTYDSESPYKLTFSQQVNLDTKNLLQRRYLHATTVPKYHEHFTLTDMTPLVQLRQQANKEVFFEEFFDTKDFALMGKECWLRRRNKDWVYKFGVVNQNGVVEYREEKDVTNIMVHLKSFGIGDRPEEVCPNPYASFPTYRYSFVSTPNISIWVDVSEFAEEVYYAVGTIERPLLNEDLVVFLSVIKDTYEFVLSSASKIVAYLFYFSPERFESLKAPISTLDLSSYDSSNVFEPTPESSEESESESVREMRSKFPSLFKLSF